MQTLESVMLEMGVSKKEFINMLRGNVSWNRSRLMLVGKGDIQDSSIKFSHDIFHKCMCRSIAGDSGKSCLNNSLRDIKWVSKKSDTVVADVGEAKVVVQDVVGGRLYSFPLCMLRAILFLLNIFTLQCFQKVQKRGRPHACCSAK